MCIILYVFPVFLDLIFNIPTCELNCVKFNRLSVVREVLESLGFTGCFLLRVARGLNLCFSEQGENSPFPTEPF